MKNQEKKRRDQIKKKLETKKKQFNKKFVDKRNEETK